MLQTAEGVAVAEVVTRTRGKELLGQSWEEEDEERKAQREAQKKAAEEDRDLTRHLKEAAEEGCRGGE